MPNKEKTYTTKQILAHIKKESKKPWSINQHLKKHLRSIVISEIKQDSRAEAMRILNKAKRNEVADFLLAHYSDSTSCGLVCVALDFIKDRLVREGKVGKRFGQKFGNNFDE